MLLCLPPSLISLILGFAFPPSFVPLYDMQRRKHPFLTKHSLPSPPLSSPSTFLSLNNRAIKDNADDEIQLCFSFKVRMISGPTPYEPPRSTLGKLSSEERRESLCAFLWFHLLELPSSPRSLYSLCRQKMRYQVCGILTSIEIDTEYETLSRGSITFSPNES